MFIVMFLIYLFVSLAALALMGVELYERAQWKKRLLVKDAMPMLAAFIPMFNIAIIIIGISTVYERHFAYTVLWKAKK